MKKFITLLLLAGFLSGAGWAASYKYSLTTPVSQEDGDSISTKAVQVNTCDWPSGAAATLIDAAVTDKSVRRRLIRNAGNAAVYIGTNTVVLPTIGYIVRESTVPVQSDYITHTTAAIYGCGASTQTVRVIKEYESKP